MDTVAKRMTDGHGGTEEEGTDLVTLPREMWPLTLSNCSFVEFCFLVLSPQLIIGQ